MTLDGMQPTLRQVPPRVPRFSMHTVFIPSWAALMAATYPPGPPPKITRSHSPPAAAQEGKMVVVGVSNDVN